MCYSTHGEWFDKCKMEHLRTVGCKDTQQCQPSCTGMRTVLLQMVCK